MAKNPPIVIVYAPHGAGKTQSAEQLKSKFGCTHIVDEWDGRSHLKPGSLALTNVLPPSVPGNAQLIELKA